MIESLTVIILSTVVFLPLISKIFKKMSVFVFSVSFLLGISVCTYVLFLANILGYSYSLIDSLIIYFVIFIFSFTASFFMRGEIEGLNLAKLIGYFTKSFRKNKFVWLVLLFLVGISLVINLYWPVKDWDALVLYDFRAKIFVLHGGITDILKQGYYTSYPYMTSLTHALVYMINPSASPMLLYFSYYVVLIVIFYSSLRALDVNQKLSLISTAALAGTGIIFDHSAIAYTNLVYAVFLFTGYALMALWYKKEKTSLLVLSALFVGLSGWIRFAEPFWMIVVVVAAFMFFAKRKYIYILFYAIFVYILRYPWATFSQSISGIPSTLEGRLLETAPLAGQGLSFLHITSVINYLYTYIFSEYGIIFTIYLSLLCYVYVHFHKKLSATYIFDLLLICGILGTICAGTLLFSLNHANWLEIGDSARRMSMILVPIVLFSTARLFSIVNTKKQK